MKVLLVLKRHPLEKRKIYLWKLGRPVKTSGKWRGQPDDILKRKDSEKLQYTYAQWRGVP